jgi:hypothetical protein
MSHAFWQHNANNLVYAAWLDNAIVKTLSNHLEEMSLDMENGMMWRGEDKSVLREMKQKAVMCPAQTNEYCET